MYKNGRMLSRELPAYRKLFYYRNEAHNDRDRLLRKLIEVEMDGQEATRQAARLKVVRHIWRDI